MSIQTLGDIKDNLRQFVSRISDLEKEDISDEVQLFKDLGIDSIKAIELVVCIQEKYRITIDDSKIPKLTTITLIAREIERLVEKKVEK